jgi:predicted DNA-binding protein
MNKEHRTQRQQSIYLEHEKAALLDTLSEQTRIPKAELMREAIDDLLVKYKMLKLRR